MHISFALLPRFAAVVLGIIAFWPNPLGAVTLNLQSDGTVTSAMLTCVGSIDPACQGYTAGGAPKTPTGLGILSSTVADLYDLGNSSPATETAALNTLAGTSFSSGDGAKLDTGGVASLTLFTEAVYLMIKIGGGTLDGNDHAFFNLLAPGEITITYDKDRQTSAGLSHITAWGGSITVVPLPAALPLLLTALGGLFMVGLHHRHKSAA